MGQVTADGSGNWAFTPATPLANGTVINALAQDAAGNNSSPTSATVDSLAPAAPVIDPSNGSVIAGTAEAGATVILTDGNGNPTRSRISPTMMMSGSCRSRARTPLAKVRSMLCWTCIWLNEGSIISIGSSMVQTFTSSVASCLSVV